MKKAYSKRVYQGILLENGPVNAHRTIKLTFACTALGAGQALAQKAIQIGNYKIDEPRRHSLTNKKEFDIIMTTSIDLTHPIHEDMPVYPGTEQPVIITGCSIEKDGFLEKKITFYSHTGTHMDAPAHLIKGGKYLDQYDISHFHGSATVVHLESNEDKAIDLGVLKVFENQLKNTDFLLIYTGWSRHWGKDDYFADFPVLTLEAAEWVAGIGLKGIGFDTISADSSDTQTYPIHKILLGSDMVIVENLANLDQLQAKSVEFTCFPLHFQQADGSPIRAVAFI